MEVPRIEVLGGYSWYSAGGTVNAVKVPNFNAGWIGQATFNSNRWVGIVIDVNGHSNQTASAREYGAGPQFKLRWGPLIPFGELLLGVQHFTPRQLPGQNAAMYAAGGGIDFRVSPRLTVRPLQIDYVSTYYGTMANMFGGFRRQGGVVYNFGLPKQPEIDATCNGDPSAVDAGAPVNISVIPSGFQPKRVLSYSYASTGGTVTGKRSAASVETAGLAPGSYTVTAKVVDDGRGSRRKTASCKAVFSVNEPVKHPPVLSVSADPTSLISGNASTITAAGNSPDSRPLTFDCTASSGKLTGSAPTLTLDTSGVPDSTITVNCTARDDRSLATSARASVKVSLPPLNPQEFGTIQFKHDTKRPTRVDNEAKGELDRLSDALAAAPDTKAVLVGYASTKERESVPNQRAKNAPEYAAQRAINTKDYLVTGKGVDASRVEARTGTDDDQKADLWIVPAGAAFPEGSTKVVDESKVKPVPRVALKSRKAARRRIHKLLRKS